jgi:hypothetical protein
MRPREETERTARELRCHICKTFSGDIAKALDDMVNRRRLFSTYTAAVSQAVLDYYRRILRNDLELLHLRATSERTESDFEDA